MDLILWRHAEAEEGSPDAARKLTGKGVKQAKAVAAWLSKRIPDDAVLIASPALRAQQTAQALRGNFATEPAVDTGASPAKLLKAAGWPGASGTVIVAGHQPTLGLAAGTLLFGDTVECSIKKGAIWWFRSRGDAAVLLAVISPELL